MKLAYDLHIHTSLSPCADNDMTPNNIVNMSILKGLDVIAITDHNSSANTAACISCAVNKPLLVIPGMEVETAEEIHVVCLFPDIENAMEMQRWIYSKLPDIKNREAVFGQQLIMDENDVIIGKEERLLLTSTAISINEVFKVVNHKMGGLTIPAHIDRQSNSLLSSFGVLPEDMCVDCVEISSKCREEYLINKYSTLRNIKRIYSSDAHYLGDISERGNFLEVSNISIHDIIKTLGNNINSEYL